MLLILFLLSNSIVTVIVDRTEIEVNLNKNRLTEKSDYLL